jgi:phytoene synthase
MELPRELEGDHLFIPGEELSVFGVDEIELGAGPPSESVKKLLWKQCVRIRDYFARALPLSKDLPRSYRVGFRRWWLGGLEVVNAIERRKYDLWSVPVELSRYHRAQARFQARFARISFGHK